MKPHSVIWRFKLSSDHATLQWSDNFSTPLSPGEQTFPRHHLKGQFIQKNEMLVPALHSRLLLDGVSWDIFHPITVLILTEHGKKNKSPLHFFLSKWQNWQIVFDQIILRSLKSLKRLNKLNQVREQVVQTFAVANFQAQANTCGTLTQTSCTLACTWSLSRRLEWIFRL